MAVDANGCYWLVRQGQGGGGTYCKTACDTFLSNFFASPNDGNGNPTVTPIYFMCTTASIGNFNSNGITVSDDGITLDPALIYFINFGFSISSNCKSM